MKGDKVPGSSPAFTISSITSGDVTFTVIDGALKNGDSSISVNLGESVSATLESGKTYDALGAQHRQWRCGGNGHTISVLSITSSNGTAMVTFEVDGKTYADKTVGDVFSTSAGEIKVIAINVGRSDRHHHARRPDDHAARRAGRREVGDGPRRRRRQGGRRPPCRRLRRPVAGRRRFSRAGAPAMVTT